MYNSHWTSANECRRVLTNINKCKWIKKFDINGGFLNRYSLICRRFLSWKHRWMKKYVLHCNRYTVVTRFFNLNFVRINALINGGIDKLYIRHKSLHKNKALFAFLIDAAETFIMKSLKFDFQYGLTRINIS